MDRYKNVMLSYVLEKINYWPPRRLHDAQEQLNDWINARDKHLTIEYFDNTYNRLFYIKCLYQCRVDCFLQILLETKIDFEIEEIIKSKSSIISFGCGPGPEIAAYICYVRNILNLKYHKLNILAVDCLPEWEEYIDVVSDIDSYSTIRFQAGRLCNQYLRNMAHSDICIMSYPHVMNFENIWKRLKQKFTLIIFIDQAKPALLQTARNHGFEFVNFFYKTPKTFFYYIDRNYNSQNNLVNYDSGIEQFFPQRNLFMQKCKRMLHNISSSSNKCNELISVPLTCGHSHQIFCYQDEQLEKMIQKCNEIVKINCNRNKHVSLVPCGTTQICQEIIILQRKCGHKLKFQCCESKNNHKLCMEMVKRTCKRGLHSTLFPCYSSPSICNAMVDINLKCGHKFTMNCYEDEIVKMKDIKCTKLVRRKCHRKLHYITYKCGSHIKCNETAWNIRPCGHEILIKCSNYDKMQDVDEPCLERVTKTCNRGIHQKTITCSLGFECEELIMHIPPCGHMTKIKCCEENLLSVCIAIVNKKCKRKLHRKKQECYKQNYCDVKDSFTFECGCRKIVDCFNYNRTKNDCVCFEDCKLAAKKSFVSLKDGNNENSEVPHDTRSCKTLLSGKQCLETCMGVLECGHKCQWRCYLCLNGRLHKPCLEKCGKGLKCGHFCEDYCHSGDCHNCPKQCFLNKIKNFFTMKHKMTKSDRQKWFQLLNLRIENETEELKNMFEKILFDIEGKLFSNKLCLKYNDTFKSLKYLLDFKDSFAEDTFPDVLEKYVKEVKLCLDALIKSINPEEGGVKSENSFVNILEEIMAILSLCKLIKRFEEEHMSEKVIKILEILKGIVEGKYDEGNMKEYVIATFKKNDI